MYSVALEDLLRDGFSKKFADYYLNLAMKEKSNPYYDQEYVNWAHSKGFLAESAYLYGLNEENCNMYLSDYDYYKIWPVNDWTRIWINDKLTLKLMLANTLYDKFMPKYYFYSTPNGLKPLVDLPEKYKNATIDSFVSLLTEVGEYACKPNNGTASLGFFKMSYKDGVFYINDKVIQRENIEEFVNSNPNYIFTEYIYPSDDFSKYSPSIHTLRLVTVNENGNDPRIIGGYFRIPNEFSGAANYLHLEGENIDKFNVFVNVNVETGEYGPAKLTYVNKSELVDVHPHSKVKLCGRFSDYDVLKEAIIGIAKRFSTVEYMGFDIGVTNDGFKIMEINSHPGIVYMQIFKPLFEENKEYFIKKIKNIDLLNDDVKRARNGIQR